MNIFNQSVHDLVDTINQYNTHNGYPKFGLSDEQEGILKRLPFESVFYVDRQRGKTTFLVLYTQSHMLFQIKISASS